MEAGLFLIHQRLSDCAEWLCTSSRLPPVSRRICQHYRVALYGDEKNGGFHFENRRTKGHEAFSVSSGFFFAATAGRLKLYYCLRQSLHKGKEILRLTSAEIRIPRFQCVALENIYPFNNLLCQQ